MMPKEHIKYSLLIGILFSVVYLIFSINITLMPLISIEYFIIIALLFLLVAVLIDIDHILHYMVNIKSISIRSFIRYCCGKCDSIDDTDNLPYLLFHNVELLGILLLIIIYSQFQLIFIIIFLAVLTHLVLDWSVIKSTRYDSSILKISLIGTVFFNLYRMKGGVNKW